MISIREKVRKFKSIHNLAMTKEVEQDLVDMLYDASQECTKYQGQCDSTVVFLLELLGKETKRNNS